MARCMKCGGSHSKKQKGGYMMDGGIVTPMYPNNPRNVQLGRVLKDGGSCGPKVIKGSKLRRSL